MSLNPCGGLGEEIVEPDHNYHLSVAMAASDGRMVV